MNNPYLQIIGLYWVVSSASIKGVISHGRTALAELVAELLHQLPSNESPTQKQADAAVQYIITGNRDVSLTASAAAGGSSSSTEAVARRKSSLGRPRDTWFTRLRKRGILVAAATVVAGATALATWLGWTPWS